MLTEVGRSGDPGWSNGSESADAVRPSFTNPAREGAENALAWQAEQQRG